MNILFVGSERAGYDVPGVSGKSVEFTGEVNSIATVREFVLKEPHQIVIIDLATLTDNYMVIAEEITKMSLASNARFIFYYKGKSPRSAMVMALVAHGFRLFVTESLTVQANRQLELCLDGVATVEIPQEEAEKMEEQKPAPDAEKQTVVAVAGCMHRIGTTTQALQIVKYLQVLGHTACYVEMNETGFVETVRDMYVEAKDTEDNRVCVTYGGVDLYPPMGLIGSIRDMPYEYIVYDFGVVDEFGQNTMAQYLEKDVRVVVGGVAPTEMQAMAQIMASPILKSNSYYIFSFVAEGDKDEVLELMMDKADYTGFAEYTPDAFTYTSASEDLYKRMLKAEKMRKSGKKSGLFKKNKKKR